MKNIFLTGSRGIGKSTLLNRLLKDVAGRVAGFRTLPVYDQKQQVVGFGLQDVEEQEEIRPEDMVGLKHPGGIKAFPETFEGTARAVLARALTSRAGLLVIDELGFLESGAPRFQEQVEICLDSAIPVLGVLKAHDNPFLKRIRQRPDVAVFEVTEENRDRLYEELRVRLGQLIADGRPQEDRGGELSE